MQNIKRLIGTLFEYDEHVIEGYQSLLNAMAFATDAGLSPCAHLVMDMNYEIYYDYKQGEGEFKKFDITELNYAAQWIKDCTERKLLENVN